MTVTAIIAEDDEANLELFSELLELYGIKILDKVSNGKTAVTSFESLRPDVIFLDVMMPEYDGLYALENIRKLDSFSNIVMVTADTSPDTEEFLKRFQRLDVVHKPYEITTIIDILEKRLDLKILS